MNEVACQATLICIVVVRSAKTGFLVTKSIFPCLLKRKIEGKNNKYVFNRILNLDMIVYEREREGEREREREILRLKFMCLERRGIR